MQSSPFIPATSSVASVMRQVIYALCPGVLLYAFVYGWGVLFNIFIACTAATFFEWVMLKIRRRPVMPYLLDGSALVTAMLLAMALPPLLDWWVPVVGAFFAIVVAKHLYGGLGYNVFNPAMAAYAILLISLPRQLSMWTAPMQLLPQPLSFHETFNFVFMHYLPPPLTFDAITSATPLDFMRSELGQGKSMADILHAPIFGQFAGLGMEWVNMGFLAGGLWLLYRRIISWHIPVALLASLALIAGVYYGLDKQSYAHPLLHLLGGASILGAFFIATDPVTASTTPNGKIIYAIGIGVLTFAIRQWGGYPDGVAFAVLLMGMTVPLLDHYTPTKVYGERARRKNK